ncbi:MAG: 50S ribosomal protein L11 methyltransferase [Armatimonas sp.]
MRWAQIEIEAAGDEQEAFGALLTEVGGCHGWMGTETHVSGFLPVDERLEGTLLNLREQAGRELTIRFVAEEDWADSWKQYFKPQKIGERFVVRPSWEEYTPAEGDLIILIDPGMAFGTGLHATTRLCLRALEQLVKPGDTVADVGTGSGILAVGAILLGAASVEATDNDPLAVKIARENAELNSQTDTIQVEVAENPPSGPFDIVVANILPDVILGMADGLTAAVKPGGYLVVSGIIERRAEDVREGLRARGLEVLSTEPEAEWVAIVARK